MHEKVSILDPVAPATPAGTTVEPKMPTLYTEPSKPIMTKFPNSKRKMPIQLTIFALFVILAGVGTGYALSGTSSANGDLPVVSEEKKATGSNEEGLNDDTSFPDTAEGTLEDGGIDGEGTHHLVREGGPSKYVYLSSTVLNLDTYKGKKVQVWGQTISGRKAGWLMDVGKIKSL
jgi:hypothetical protein